MEKTEADRTLLRLDVARLTAELVKSERELGASIEVAQRHVYA